MIGKPVNRLDTVDKSTGNQVFGIDITRPGMKTVLIARPPWFSGKAIEIDDGDALAIDGVELVMPIELPRGATGAAVVANAFWPASKGRESLNIEWQPPEGELPDSTRIDAEFKDLLSRKGLPARTAQSGNIEKTSKTITADFRFPLPRPCPDGALERGDRSQRERCRHPLRHSDRSAVPDHRPSHRRRHIGGGAGRG